VFSEKAPDAPPLSSGRGPAVERAGGEQRHAHVVYRDRPVRSPLEFSVLGSNRFEPKREPGKHRAAITTWACRWALLRRSYCRPGALLSGGAGPEPSQEEHETGDTKAMSPMDANTTRSTRKMKIEGVTVIGGSVRRVCAESAEFLIEIAAGAPTAAQALRDNHVKTTQGGSGGRRVGVQQRSPDDLAQRYNCIHQ